MKRLSAQIARAGKRASLQPSKKSQLALMQPLFVVAPFIGYLAAYLIEIGAAGYYRIPTSYVSIGIEDALMMGSVLIVLSVMSFVLYKYFVQIAPWRFRFGRPFIENRHGTPCPSSGKELTRYRISLLAYECLLAFVTLVSLFFGASFFVLFVNVLCMAGSEAGGRDFAIAGLVSVGAALLFLASLYLYHSESGRSAKEELIPGQFAGLKNKHIVVGLTAALFLGAFCYLGSFCLSSFPQNYLVDSEKHAVLLKEYSNGGFVVAEYVDVEKEVIRLTGKYSLVEPANGFSGFDEFGLEWRHCAVERAED